MKDMKRQTSFSRRGQQSPDRRGTSAAWSRFTAIRWCCCMAVARPGMPGAAPRGASPMPGHVALQSINADMAKAPGLKTGPMPLMTTRRMRSPCAARFASGCGKPPVLVGASLGGISGLMADHAWADPICLPGLVLVDITPHMDADGVSRIQGFMASGHARGVRHARRCRGGDCRLSAAPQAATFAGGIWPKICARILTAATAGTGIRLSSMDRAISTQAPKPFNSGWSMRRAGSPSRCCWFADSSLNW
jgi:hypothetical protein